MRFLLFHRETKTMEFSASRWYICEMYNDRHVSTCKKSGELRHELFFVGAMYTAAERRTQREEARHDHTKITQNVRNDSKKQRYWKKKNHAMRLRSMLNDMLPEQ